MLTECEVTEFVDFVDVEGCLILQTINDATPTLGTYFRSEADKRQHVLFLYKI